ncbi:sugar-binding domain-containing protein [Paenibacillus sp. MWE-103]|uniref:Sugar-binding domain-containing protein n=1 Tax=Paenibacillus artemisiicola TaxID=1172618 RepID=A0ABS3WIQ8_9BACL|nr:MULTISPECIES: sugar-binding domain-containing protein [Paenibacillus]MBO7748216.1 sugar-binding domain-containing protein [Paenibacillus artemisiicola]SFI81671.1 central glycolytic genes regulator [Paenibacillus sp. UNC496MF]
MHALIAIQQQLLPDLLVVMRKRYLILRQVMLSDMIGRRSLAASLDMTERVLRAETDFLKSQDLLIIDAGGMRISEAGKRLLEEMEPFYKAMFGLSELEEKIRRHFGLKQVVIVSGDSDESPVTRRELGRAGCSVLRKDMKDNDVIAVTGGSTLAQMAGQLTSQAPLKNNLFVPARGGLGESLDYQANTIASTMAKRTGAQYRLLHVPDHLGEEAYTSLMQEPNVREIVEVIRRSRIVVHGIGDAMVMARRRRVDATVAEAMQAEGALAESFGYYFDRNGAVVHKMLTAGLRLEDIMETEVVIAIAGGRSKGEAIAAVMRFGHDDVLVTDEAAALEIASIIDKESAQQG